MINFPEIEEKILKFWQLKNIFKKTLDKESPKGDYSFYDGPPFATGKPHYGHIVASLMKDMVPRYWTMKGYHVERKCGWDCHGLPIENIVEKELKLKNKKDIEGLGIEKFNEACRSKVLIFADEWRAVIDRLGRWVDMDDDYKTMDKEYMESIWWVFKQLWDKDLIYEGYKSMHICPRCETTLSQSEVGQGYEDVVDLSATVKFELVDEPGTYILSWTTTPWTLFGNVALAVGEDINYLLIEDKKNREKYILAEDNHQNVLKYYPGEEEHNYQIVKKFKGKDLIGKKYKPLFKYLSDIVSNGIKPMVLKRIKNNKAIDLVPQTARRRGVYNDTEWKKLMKNFQESNDVIEMFKNNSYKIYSADFVNTDEGTGVVHIAPAFGEDDFNLSQKYNLPLVQHVLPDGRLNEDVVSFSYREGLSDNFIKLHEDFIESLKDKDLSNSLNKWVGLEVKPKDNPTVTDKKIVDYLEKKGLIFASEKYTHSYPHCWRCDSPLLNYTTSSWFVNVEKNKKKFLKTAKNINWMPDHVKEGRFGKWLEGARDWSISRQRYWGSVMPIWVCRKCGQKKVIGSIQELEKASDQKVEDLHKHHVDKIEIPCEKCEGKMKRIPDVLDCWFESGSMPYAQLHYPFENQDKFKKNFPAEFIAEGADQTRAWFYYLHVLATAIKKSEAFKNVVVNGIVLAEDGKKMSKKLSNYPDPMEMFNKYGADAMRFYLASAPVMKADDLNFSEKDVDTVYKKVLMMLGNVLSFYKMFEVQGLAADTSSKNILDRWIITKIEILKYEITKAYEGYDLVKATRPLAEFINELSTWYLRRSRSRFKSDSQQKKAEALKTLKYVLQNLALIMSPVMPFTADYLYQESGGKLESVHLEKWPEVNQKFFQEEQIIKDMESARNIVELALAKRDEAGVKVRQPLSQIIISSEPLADELVELIKDEVNIKEVVFKPAGILSVKLDTNITAELKEEGLYRELVRTINQLRKEAELTIKDIVAISFQTDSNTVKTVINNFKNELLKNTISSDIAEEKPEGCLIYKDVKVNEEEVWLGLK